MVKHFRSDRMVYVDFEMTCWDGPAPEGMRSEIIQVGGVEVCTKTLNVMREFDSYIRPTMSTVSPFCTKLTKIKPKTVARQGRDWAEVHAWLLDKYGLGSKAIFAWGRDDEAVQNASALAGITPKFEIINLALLFRVAFGFDRGVGLTDALTFLGLEFEGVAHNALVDARNTARVHRAMIEKLRS